MYEKIKTGLWFLKQPGFWPHALALASRRMARTDHEAFRAEAEQWAAERAIPFDQALDELGLLKDREPKTIPVALTEEAEELAKQSRVRMGGPGHLDLLYSAVLLSGAERVVETGVAYGWSSLAILSAMDELGSGRLASVDMPYPKAGNEAFVGIAVPERLRARWTLIRLPDRGGLAKAIRVLGGTIDLAHYDSDKSYSGRMYAYPLIWAALRSGGVFISDDIGDNFGFRDFAASVGAPFRITSFQGKCVGIIVKP